MKLNMLLKATLVASLLLTVGCQKVTINKKNDTLTTSHLGLKNTFIYSENSTYSSILKDCVASDDEQKSCSLNTLPLLRETTSKITKEDIKSRLVVSHKWMGDNFLQVLDLLDDDILQLFGSVTAIVIDDDINPAFYTTQTGAIYIDPRYLWLTKEQASDITKNKDFRSEYGNTLKFIPAWRYVKGNKNAIEHWGINNPQNRTIEDLKLNLARLLYHELSHANDFANKNLVDGVDRDLPIIEALEQNKEERISTKLYNSMPLTQNKLKHFGQVLFFGKTATAQDRETSGEEMGALFDTDSASNMYNYANQYEDFAMLFETAMMKYHYNIEMDIGFVTYKKNAKSCDDYTVEWGVRNRIANKDVSKRVKLVLQNIYPNKSWDDFINNKIGTSTKLKTDTGWCSSININSNSNTQNLRLNNTKKEIKIPYQDFNMPNY